MDFALDILFWILLAGALIGLAVNFVSMMEEFENDEDEDET